MHSSFISRRVAACWFALMLQCLASAVDEGITIGNELIGRTLSWQDRHLRTLAVRNGELGKSFPVGGNEEFAITVSVGGQSRVVTSRDFDVTGVIDISQRDVRGREVTLSGDGQPLSLRVRYWVAGGEPVLRKAIDVIAKSDLVIDRVQVEVLGIPDAYNPYRPTEILAVGPAKWHPPLGQPVYTGDSAMWWGVEFPAARNHARDGSLSCGYLTRVALKKGGVWTSHPSVMGAADDPRYLKDAFFDYIDSTRARPLRLQTQYNSWFDFGVAVDTEKFTASVAKVNEELVVRRGVPPLQAYVIDDGWQDTKADWSKSGVWPENGKFADDFKACRKTIADAGSHLGLWLSPGCLFNAQPAIPSMRAAGWRTLDPWMSLAGEPYMTSLEKRLVALAASPVGYFKFDGLFGHLNKRNFDVDGFKGGENDLNDSRYDEAKERYLSLGTERLMRVFKRMGEVNPEIYLTISNGAFLSAWWLQSVDAVWMINAGDAAGGADRNGELVYRDSVYYRIVNPGNDNAQFPLHSIFNHEPKKTTTGEDAEIFRRYLFMNLSRGTGFVELYLKTRNLGPADWDVLAEGLKWAHKVFPNFKRSRMIGGNPAQSEVYGYSGWTESSGYVSLHNPSSGAKSFTVVLNREFGLPKQAVAAGAGYLVSSPFKDDADGLDQHVSAGGQITITLPPKGIRVLEFSRMP